MPFFYPGLVRQTAHVLSAFEGPSRRRPPPARQVSYGARHTRARVQSTMHGGGDFNLEAPSVAGLAAVRKPRVFPRVVLRCETALTVRWRA